MSASWLRILCFLAADTAQPVKSWLPRRAAKYTRKALSTRFDALRNSGAVQPLRSQATGRVATAQDRARIEHASEPSRMTPRSARAYPPAQDSVNARFATDCDEPAAFGTSHEGAFPCPSSSALMTPERRRHGARVTLWTIRAKAIQDPSTLSM